MSNEIERLPITEDPIVIDDVLERFDYHLREIEGIADKDEATDIDGATRTLEAVRLHVQELYAIGNSCTIPPIVEPLEVLYRVYSMLQKGHVELPNLLQATIAILERLHGMIRLARKEKSIDFDSIQSIQKAIMPLAHSLSESDLYKVSGDVFNLLVGDFQTKDEDDGVELFSEHPFFDNQVEIPRVDVDRANFSCMRIISETIDARQLNWVGRTEKILSLAIGMNAMAENIVDVDQLEAAVYLHDFGMLRFSDELLSKKKLSSDEFQIIITHPVTSYELTLALPGLSECAKMVYQHHERIDGKGYPEGITGKSICHGAKILAICDAFYSMTHSTAHKPQRRSILRTLVEINACGNKQFDAFWVDKLNKVVRAQRIGGFL